MQRKRTKDVYVHHVDMGTSVLPVAQMRKFAMTKLIKVAVVVIIGFIIYSVYSKNNMASNAAVDTMSIYDDTVVVGNKMDKPNKGESAGGENENKPAERRIKEQINKVFEEFRQKQENKQKQEDHNNEHIVKDSLGKGKDGFDVVNDDKAEEGIDDDIDNDNIEDDDNKFNQENQNLDDKENIAEEFEDINEAEEREERKLDQDIEKRLADAFGDAVKEVGDANKDIAVEAAKDDVRANAIPAARKSIDDHANIEMKKIIEHLEFNLAVDKMGKRLNPREINRLNADARREALRHDYDHEFPPLITAVRQTTINQIKQLIATVHHNLPGRKLHIYDLDLTPDQRKDLMTICGVRLKVFLKGVFPDYVSDLDNLHWKPLVMQTALAEFAHILWINPGFIFTSSELAPLVHESHERGVLVLGQTASYTTFAATHPDMLKFISTDKDKLAKEPHVEIKAVFLHNTQEVHDNIMKVFTACALETSCLAPSGSKWSCRFDFTGRKYANCHRYDESALNILLKNFFNFDTVLFTRRNTYLRRYDKDYRPNLRQCRKPEDIRDTEF